MKQFEEWEGFKGRIWKEEINTRDFIQENYTPYDGDESFLAGSTEATDKLWGILQGLQKEERKKGGVLDMDTDIVSSLTSHGPGYISEETKDLEQIVGLQTDKPLKRAFMPYGGIKMAEESCRNYGYEPSERLHEIFTKYSKTHNTAVFDAYTPEMKKARHNKIITGLPDTYGRGRIVGDYRRVALYGIDYLLEEKASNGYKLDPNKYYFDVTLDQLHPEVQVFEDVIKRTFQFIKVYADNKTGIMTPEIGVKFGIYNNKNELVKTLITDAQGSFDITLPYGKYVVKQLTSTKGYEKAKDFTIEVKEDGGIVKKVIANAEITARLKVIKIDKDTGDVIKRSGIKFKIINAKTKKYVKQTITYPSAKTIDVFETDENGILITPYPLESGTYFLEEVDQKIDGYLWNKNSVEFTIDENSKLVNDDEFGILYEVKFENKAVKGSLELTKTGEKVELTNKGYVYTEINLKDVKIGLYANEDIYDSLGNLKYKKDTLIKILITDENGYAKVENLFLGKYYLQEIETINNHILDKTKYTFELKYKDQYTKIINYTTLLKNHLPKGTLEFTKSDFSNDKTLPNTLIEIYTENDELVYVGRTDSNGKIIINELPLGKYYIIEKQAPEGYKINPDKMWFEISEDGKIVKAIMKDEVIEVPNTGVNDSHIIDIIGLVFITGGVGFIIYDKKRKK